MQENIREYYATEPVPITQYKEEFAELLKLFKLLDPYSILELGTHYGGTLYQWMINAKDSARIVSVDDHQLNSRMYKDWKKEGQDVHTILGKTFNEDIVNKVRDLGPYDFIFIDADHSYDSVWHDFNIYKNMIDQWKPSLIVFHDILPYKNTEVNFLWEEIKNDFTYWEFIEDMTQAGCGIGVLLIEPTR